MMARKREKQSFGTAAKAINELVVTSIAAMQAVESRTKSANLPRIPMVVRMSSSDVCRHDNLHLHLHCRQRTC
jgi:hypothetical protein